VTALLHPLILRVEGATKDAEVGTNSSRRVNGDSFVMVQSEKWISNTNIKRYTVNEMKCRRGDVSDMGQ
jgi:hypothetical protein